jgi:regulator of protease activity HflC (stomatin/prohibitin superfamily)
MATYPWSLDGKPPPPPPQHTRWRTFFDRYLPRISIVLMVVLAVAFVLYPYVVMTVPSGHVGVLWKRLRGGTILDPNQLRGEGLRLILPWDKLFLYDLRLQTTTDTYNAISKDGVSLTATINVRFLLKRQYVPKLHQTIGPDYVRLLVRPEIGSRMREIIAEYTAEEVYSTKRQEIQARIRGHAVQMLGEKTMQVEQSEYDDPYKVKGTDALDLSDTLVLGIELPPAVVGAINRKIEQYYLVQEYTFRVEREQKESERKQIEANGIRAFQQTVSQGISDSYLRWRGIEATLQLAHSPNSKVVIVGGGKDGLPIILGNVDTSSPSSAGAAPARAQPEGAAGTEGTPPVEKTSAGLTTPSEQTRSSALTTPAEKPTATRPTPSDKKPDAGSTTPSTAKPEDSSAPLRWSDIQALISRVSQAIRSTSSETAPTSKQASDKPVAEPR